MNRSGLVSVVNMLALQAIGHLLDPPLLQSFGSDNKPRSCLHDLVNSGMLHDLVNSGMLNSKTRLYSASGKQSSVMTSFQQYCEVSSIVP